MQEGTVQRSICAALTAFTEAMQSEITCGNDINLELFEEAAGLGWVTENRFRKEGAASGYYPIVTLPQVCHIDNMSGYSRLMAMETKDAEELADKGARLHTQWVGAETFFTQAAARIGYLGATTDADYLSYVGGLMLAGGHRQRRIRPAVNFRQRYLAAADDGTAWGDQVD
jgi:hypothetical protein